MSCTCGQVMTLMFEVQDLAVASPATVSRCGMVFLEPSILGLSPFTECWLRTIPVPIQPHAKQLDSLFTQFLQVSKGPFLTVSLSKRIYIYIYEVCICSSTGFYHVCEEVSD